MARQRDLRLRLVLPALGLYAVFYLTVLSVATGSRFAVDVDDLGNLFSPLLACGACVMTARRSQGRRALTWLLLGGFAGTWALGQLAWVSYEVVLRVAVPFPGLPDVGYLLSVPFVLLALLVHPDAPSFTSGRLRMLTDGVLVGASLLLLSWRLVLGDAYRDAGAHGAAQLLGLAYPALDVVVLTLLLLVAVRAQRARGASALLVTGCLVAGVFGHVVYGVLVQNGHWTPGNPVDGAWGVGYLLLALGAHLEAGTERPAPLVRISPVRTAVLPYAPVVLVLLLASVDVARGQQPDRVSSWLMVVIVGSVLLRQVLALREIGALSGGLERTVEDRTEELRLKATTDALTGLPNRAALYDQLATDVAAGRSVSLALLDLDGFKRVNDSYGHEQGDALLCAVAGRLAGYLPPGGLLARLGGDEFAVLLPFDGHEQALRAGRRLVDALAAPFALSGRSQTVSGSLGIACEGDTPEDLLRNADVAMYAAKAGPRVSLFEAPMREALLADVQLEAELRTALLAGEVVPWFQPFVGLDSGETWGVEALARWRHDGQFVSPEVFIPLAEQTGLITLLGRQVLRASCMQAATWHHALRARGGDGLVVSVNLSAVQLASEDLVDQVREALRDSGLPADQLVLEITETAFVHDIETVAPRLAALRELGIRIALDDFGTGWSALGYLQTLPVDILKIDRAFVTDVHRGPRQSALAAAVMTLASSLGLAVIAEGIEHREQAEALRALGCVNAQGWLWSPAKCAADLTLELLPSRAARHVT